jgi:hypothetical protein
VTLAVQPGIAEASEGPRAEEAKMVTAGEGEQEASGRERCDGRASWERRRLFVILRNGERTKVNGNKPIGMVVHRPRKHGVRTVERPHCIISIKRMKRNVTICSVSVKIVHI